jgi:hypothetical protein
VWEEKTVDYILANNVPIAEKLIPYGNHQRCESFWNCHIRCNKKRCDSELEIKHLCFSSEVNEMGTTVQYHVGEEFILVDLTSFCTGNSDAYWYFIFDEVLQMIIGTITGSCFLREIPGGICPCHSVIDEENIYRVSFPMGNFCELKTPGCFFIVILTKRKQEIRHV